MSDIPIRGRIINGIVTLEHKQRPHLAPLEISWGDWQQLVHEIETLAKLQLDESLPDERGNCWECDRPFSDDEWDNRHSDPEGMDVHEECCVICAGP